MEPAAPQPARILLGPGPSDVHSRVLKAMATPVIGHLDPHFLGIMDRVQADLRLVFGTRRRATLAVPGTGSAGMEAALVNFLEPGDKVVVGVNGLFGQRLCDVARRCGAEVHPVEAPWGRALDGDDLRRAARRVNPKIVAVVHAETSTGVLQPLAPVVEAAHDVDALLLVDCVTSLGGLPVDVDARNIDIAYSGTQKCLSCPPGLAPLTVGETALAALRNRRDPVQSWYLDLSMILDYWADEEAGGTGAVPKARFYHHTAPISMIYALAEALTLIREEGLAARYERHIANGRALWTGLRELGLELLVEEDDCRLPVLTTVKIPAGVDDGAVRGALLADYGIEIGGGLGPLKGKVWRVGLMGHSSQGRNVDLLLTALGRILDR